MIDGENVPAYTCGTNVDCHFTRTGLESRLLDHVDLMSRIVSAGDVEIGVGKLGGIFGERLELGMLEDFCRVVVVAVFRGRDGCNGGRHRCERRLGVGCEQI